MAEEVFERLGIFLPKHVLPYVMNSKSIRDLKQTGKSKKDPDIKLAIRHNFLGHPVKMTSQTLRLFKSKDPGKGLMCVECGIVGTFFALERRIADKDDPTNKDGVCQMRLYALKPDGTEVLMTKDHIEAKSKGGVSKLPNYQTMCVECNWKKEDRKPHRKPTHLASQKEIKRKICDIAGKELIEGDKVIDIRDERRESTSIVRIDKGSHHTIVVLAVGCDVVIPDGRQNTIPLQKEEKR